MLTAIQTWLDKHPNVGQVIVSTTDTGWSGGGRMPTGNWTTLHPTPK